MKLLLIVLTLLILSISGSMALEGYINDIKIVKSTIDGRSYLVRNLPDSVKAANLLAEIRSRLVKIVDYLGRKYPKEAKVNRLIRNFDPDQISESTVDSRYTSYSVNKGEKIVFCVRQRDELNQLVDINTMMFVAIHELAHIMTVSIGHTPEFWDNMRFILKEASVSNLNVYRYESYHNRPVPYCGTMITDTPLKENV